MKKILYVTALIGITWAQSNAQNPAAVSTAKETPADVQAAEGAVNAPKPSQASPAKPATHATPATPATPATRAIPAKPAVRATPAKPASRATVKRPHKVAPASVRKGKPVMHKHGTHGKKDKVDTKPKQDPGKPIAPGTDDKK